MTRQTQTKPRRTRPWRVEYRWDTGISGVATRPNQDEAELLADRIRRNAEAQDREVTVTVRHRDAQ